jgi:hypothetical protein
MKSSYSSPRIIFCVCMCSYMDETCNIMHMWLHQSQISKNVGLCKGSSAQHSSINLVNSSQFIGNCGPSNSFIFSKMSLVFTGMLPNGAVRDKISEHVTAKDHTSARNRLACDSRFCRIFSGAVYSLFHLNSITYYN